MATGSFKRRIMGAVEIGNLYCLIGDNRILILQICLLNNYPLFIRLLSEFLNLSGCHSNINSQLLKKVCFSRTISRLKVTYMFMVFATSLVVFLLLCHYANMSVQYTAIFHGCKNDNFQMKNCDIFLFLLKT